MLLFAAALACVECHSDLVERYARTPMANTSGKVRAEDEVGGKVGRQFTITPALNLLWSGGRVELSFFIGSRRMGRSYAFDFQGHLYQAPVGYYANRQSWDLAPGYEHDSRPDLSRPITPECLFCHATRSTVAAGTVNRYREIAAGIQCARCHGETTDHTLLVNPRKLAARLRDSVCEQCHLSGEVRIVQPGKRLADFRPGDDIAEYLEVFTGGAKVVSVAGHASGFAASRCKQMSGDRMWCGTCHNPHEATQKSAESYVAICQGCHSEPHDTANCLPCHMPKAKARDGGHTVFTDHRIGIGSSAQDRPLASYFGRPPTARNLGLAYVELGTRKRDLATVEKAWPLLREAAAAQPKDPGLYHAIANILNGSGRKAQAIAYYERSLAQDPMQPDALLKLAELLAPSVRADELRDRALRMLPHPAFH